MTESHRGIALLCFFNKLLHLYRYKGDCGKEKVLNHLLYYLLHDEPNPEMSSFVFWETLMTHLLLWGNAYA